MRTYFFLYVGIALQLLVLARGLRTRLFARYPLFYAQLAFSFLVGGLLFCWCVAFAPSLYRRLYWDMQFLTMFFACVIVFEVLRHVFRTNLGARRFAKMVGMAFFLSIMIFVVAFLRTPLIGERQTAFVVLERDVRAVQAVFIFAIVVAIFYYGLSLGRNLKGMFLGYGIYVCTSLITLAIEVPFETPFYRVWSFFQPLAYSASLVIFAASLWSYSPPPLPRLVFEPGRGQEKSFVSRIQWFVTARPSGRPRVPDAGGARPG